MGNAKREPKSNGSTQPLESDEHRLELTRRTAQLAEWQCRRCGRHVRLDFATRRFSILAAGDQLINHGSATLGEGVHVSGAVSSQPKPDTIH